MDEFVQGKPCTGTRTPVGKGREPTEGDPRADGRQDGAGVTVTVTGAAQDRSCGAIGVLARTTTPTKFVEGFTRQRFFDILAVESNSTG
jgi:hypothetical protein